MKWDDAAREMLMLVLVAFAFFDFQNQVCEDVAEAMVNASSILVSWVKKIKIVRINVVMKCIWELCNGWCY